MLRISKLADYATMVMAFCAREPENSHTAKEIALATRLQLPTVSKLLKILARHQLLLSQRGVQGGYQLAKEPYAITMAEVVAAVDGPIALTECNHHASVCGLAKCCTTKKSWQTINQVVSQTLSNITLADIH